MTMNYDLKCLIVADLQLFRITLSISCVWRFFSFRKKLKQVKIFLQKLQEKIPHLHLWVASCSRHFKLHGWKERFLTIPVSLPPAVVRQTKQSLSMADGSEYTTSKHLPFTDGLPVKIFCHLGQGHSLREPRDCDACGMDIATFLQRDLNLTDRGTYFFICTLSIVLMDMCMEMSTHTQ